MTVDVVTWVGCRGNDRALAVAAAADHLLRDYWNQSSTAYVDLDLLADLLQIEIRKARTLEGDARLVPKPQGFVVLVDAGLSPNQRRLAIAHEVAHTLFYERDSKGTPRRIVETSKWEEHFCFDTARWILAPPRLIKDADPFMGLSVGWTFWTAVNRLRLSRPTAARVLLRDHEILTGVAGRWMHLSGEWILSRGSATASASLVSSERQRMHNVVREALQEGVLSSDELSVVLNRSLKSNSVFALVAEGKDGLEEFAPTPENQQTLF